MVKETTRKPYKNIQQASAHSLSILQEPRKEHSTPARQVFSSVHTSQGWML